MPKTERLVVRLTATEVARLNRKRGPLTKSAWVRAQINAPAFADAFPPFDEVSYCGLVDPHPAHRWNVTFSDGEVEENLCPGITPQQEVTE